MVKRVEHHIIKPAHQFYLEIDALCQVSKNLYNCVMYSARYSFFYGYGVPSLAQLHALFKDSQPLLKSASWFRKQVCDAWDSYFKALSNVVIGKNVGWKTSVNLGRVNNQKFVQIPYNKFISLLTYKLEAVGIQVIVHEESYTRKASFLDWDDIPTYDPNSSVKSKFSGKRIQRAWYKAGDARLIYADVNGAFNIGRIVIPTAFVHLKDIVAEGIRMRGSASQANNSSFRACPCPNWCCSKPWS